MNKKKLILSYIYIIATVIIIGWLLSRGIEQDSLKQLLSDLNYVWLIGAVGCILLHWLTDAVIIRQITPFIAKEKISLVRCIKYGLVGLYYSALTPFASGGQPLQVIYMKRDGIPVGKSTAIVSVKHFVYLTAMCFTFIFYMVIRGAGFFRNYHAIFWIAVLGFIANLIGVIFIFIMLTRKELAIKICKWIIMVLHKLRVVRHEEKAYGKIEKTILDFSRASSYIKTHKTKTVISFMLSLVKLSFLFAVPFMIFRAFNLTGYGMWDLSSLNTFMFLTVSFMPTPGTSFAAEGGFTLIYSPIFGSFTAMAIAAWRFITYYLILMVGGLVVVFDQIMNLKKGKADYKTNDEEPTD